MCFSKACLGKFSLAPLLITIARANPVLAEPPDDTL